ncbi:MAG: hypothetical protein U5K27_03620 [Desulfotignum sp.]|nr:hypothetical protein [Desulfotignum sp.]
MAQSTGVETVTAGNWVMARKLLTVGLSEPFFISTLKSGEGVSREIEIQETTVQGGIRCLSMVLAFSFRPVQQEARNGECSSSWGAAENHF